MTDSIKIALDLLDPDSLARTLTVAKEFRAYRLATGYGEDVLQVFNILWHAWRSLGQQAANKTNSAMPGNKSMQSMPTSMRVHTSEVNMRTSVQVDGQNGGPSSTSSDLGVESLGSRTKRNRAHRAKRLEKQVSYTGKVELGQASVENTSFPCLFCRKKSSRNGILQHMYVAISGEEFLKCSRRLTYLCLGSWDMLILSMLTSCELSRQ